MIVSRGIEHSKDRMCNVLKIPSQKNFNLTKFQGKWYAAQKTTSEDSLLAYFMEIYDGRIIFTLNKEKNYDLRACEYIREKYIGLDERKSDIVACEQERRRSDCAYAQSDLRLLLFNIWKE